MESGMAVYTEVADEELDAFIESYAIGELTSCKGIAEGVENSNFLLHTSKFPLILTLGPDGTSIVDRPV